MYSRPSKCFWNRYKAAWPFRCEPSSDHDVPTAAELRQQLFWSLRYVCARAINGCPHVYERLEVGPALLRPVDESSSKPAARPNDMLASALYGNSHCTDWAIPIASTQIQQLRGDQSVTLWFTAVVITTHS